MNAAKIDKSPPLQRMHDLLKGGQPVSGFVLDDGGTDYGLVGKGVDQRRHLDSADTTRI